MNRFARRAALALLLSCIALSAQADGTAQVLPFSQAWSDTTLVTTNDDWSGVPGIVGYRGDDITSSTGVDPQTLLGEGTITVDVNAQATATSTTGGILEIEAAGTIAMQGSGTADAPGLVINLDTTGQSGINVAYVLRDLDASSDDAQQQFALQYRIGDSGDFANVPAGYVADATTANAATQVTPVSATLPAAADDQPLVQVRIITSNAAGNDELVGVDDIAITAGGGGGSPVVSISDTSTAEGNDGNTTFLFTLSLNAPAGEEGVTVDYTIDGSGTATPGEDFFAGGGSVPILPGDTSVTIAALVIGDTVTEPDETFFVNLVSATGADIGDAQGIGTIVNDDIATIAIHAIQGSTDTSPLLGLEVSTRGIVTGRKSNGFFLQAPDAGADADPATSEGIFVFSGGTPPAAAQIGNEVIVTGTVAEFLPAADPGQLNLTELVSPEVVFLSAGNALPTPVMLTPDFPSPAGPLDQLERVEGMRVTAESFTVVAATGGSTSETNATGSSNGQVHLVVTGTPRPFREPGIQAPDPAPGAGSIPPIPRWDFNPELLFSDTDALGGTRYDLAVGAKLQGYVGPLDYGFRRYSVHQDPTVAPAITQGSAPWRARPQGVDEFTYATYNLERFFDEVNDPTIGEPVLTAEAFDLRLTKASLGIRDYMNAPDILGLVEVENLATLQALAARIGSDATAAGQPDPQYAAYLLEGNDVGGIDVGFLVKTVEVSAGTPRVEVVGEPQQLGKDVTWNDPVNGPGTLLNDRPPLLLDAIVHFANGRQFPITVIAVHQRSLNGAEDDDVGGDRTRTKRQLQADFLADQIEAMQLADPQRRIAVAGDFNAFEFNDGLTDVLGAVTGLPSADEETAVAGDGVDLVTEDLLNLYIEEPIDQRYSFEFGGNAQSLDHVLINQALGAAATSVGLDHARINADYPESTRGNPLTAVRLSDHDPTIAYINLTSADLRMEAETITTIVAPGGQLEFQATITNLGPDTANFPGLGVAVNAELPDLTVATPPDWACDAPNVTPGTTTIACAGGSLDADDSAPFDITATAPASSSGTTISMTASAHAQTFDPVAADNTASVEALVEGGADLAVDIDGPDTAFGASFVEYAIAVSNLGGEAAIDPELQVEVSSRSLTSSLAVASGWRCTRELLAAATRFVCRAGGVPGGTEVMFRLRTQARAFRETGSIEVQAIVASANADANLANNQDIQETLLR